MTYAEKGGTEKGDHNRIKYNYYKNNNFMLHAGFFKP
jgi:hypothetical protein